MPGHESYQLGNHSVGKVNGYNCVGIQNNFMGLVSIKPVKLSKDHPNIRVFRRSMTDWVDIVEYVVVSFIAFGILLYLLIFHVVFENFENISELYTKPSEHFHIIFLFTFISMMILIIFGLADKYRKKIYLKITNELIAIGEQDSNKILIQNEHYKEISFQNMRSLYSRKSLFGYTFFLSIESELKPYMIFNTECIHIANTINDLIVYNISKQREN